MDKNEFGLLTPEEIDEVVAEVLEEAGITIKEMSKADADKLKAFQKKHGFKVGSAGAKTAAEEAEEDRRQSAQAKKNTSAEMDADHPDMGSGAPAGRPPAGGGKPPGGPTDAASDELSDIDDSPTGFNAKGDAGLGSAMAHAQNQGNIGGAGAEPKGDGKDSRFNDPDADQDAGQKAGEQGLGDIGKIGQAWYTPGSSNLPKALRNRVIAGFGEGSTMSPVEVVTKYIRAGHGSDITSLMAKEEYKMTLARLDRYIKQAQKTGDETDAMEVRRVLDSLLDLSMKLQAKKGGGGEDPPVEPPEPPEPPVDPPDDPEDDKKFVDQQGMRTFFAKTTDLSNEQVESLATAVEADLGIMKEGRKPKEMPKTVEYILSLPEELQKSATKGVVDWLKSTEFAIAPEHAKALGLGGKKEKDPYGVQDQGKDPLTWMLKMHKLDDYRGATVMHVRGLAAAVEKDLAPDKELNERTAKSFENAFNFISKFEGKPQFEGLKKLLADFLRTTEYELDPTQAELLGFDVKPDGAVDDEETGGGVDDGTDDEDGTEDEEKQKHTFGLHRSFRLLKIDLGKKGQIKAAVFLDQFAENYAKLAKKKGWQESSWESDWAALLDEIGKVKRRAGKDEEAVEEAAVRIAPMTREMGLNKKAFSLLQARLRKIEQLMKSEESPAGRALAALLAGGGKVGSYRLVGAFLAAVWENITLGGRAKGGEEEAPADAEQGGEVIQMPTRAAAPPADDLRVAAESTQKSDDTLLAESTMNRWKTLSGIKRKS